MPACPWCQAPVADPRFPCRSCGKRPKDHVSFSNLKAVPPAPAAAEAEPVEELLEIGPGSAEAPQELIEIGPASATPEEAPELDVPDLAIPSLAPPARKGPPAASAQAHAAPGQANKVPSFAPPPMAAATKAAPAAAARGFGAFDDMEMTGNDLGSIDLGTGMVGAQAMPESMRGGSGPPSEVPEWARVSVVNAPAGPQVPRVAAVSTVMLSEDGGRAAAEKIAAYGPAPSEWWKAPIYAYQVKMRQMQLRKDLADKRVDLEKAQAATDDALVVLAERVRAAVHHKDAYSKLLDAVIVAEATLKDRDSELAAATEAHKKQTGGLDARITEHEKDLAGARAEEKACEDVFARVDAIRQRADAKVKRVDIDLRAATARANAAGVPGAATSPSDPEVIARTAEREARLLELEQAMPAVADATQKLNAAKKKVNGIEQKMLAVKNERAALEQAFKKRGAAHGAQVAKAQKDVRTAMAALGRAVSLDVATFGAEWTEARLEIVKLDKVVASRDDDVMLLVMALDAHDAKVVSKGMGLVFGLVGLVVALVALPLLVSVLSPKPPPPRPQPVDVGE